MAQPVTRTQAHLPGHAHARLSSAGGNGAPPTNGPHTSTSGARFDVANAAVTRAETTSDDDVEDEKYRRRIRVASTLYVLLALAWAYIKSALRMLTGGRGIGPIAVSQQTEYRTSFSQTAASPSPRHPCGTPSVLRACEKRRSSSTSTRRSYTRPSVGSAAATLTSKLTSS
eukprot:Opistho-1_new@27395